MKLTRLSVANLRAFEQAEFDFHPTFTLLVGVNGAGKTTVLDTLRISLSRLLPKLTSSRSRPESFDITDIRVGAEAMTIDLVAAAGGADFNLVIHKQREQSIVHKSGVVREQTLATPDKETLIPEPSKSSKILRKLSEHQPFGLYFSTRRSLPSDEEPKFGQARGGQAVAFVDALAARPLRLGYLARWMHVQQQLVEEFSIAAKHLQAFQDAARRLLPECEDLRVERDEKERARLYVTKRGVPLDIRQLSDGERSTLALALDLAQRLSQANPGLDDPVRDGKAVVLIDEIDLHLHPHWQREIVARLSHTFPHCQFIATTHSPQVIGEVPHDQIRIIKGGRVYAPSRSFGIDSSRVLEEVMDTKSRNADVEHAISTIARLIGDGNADEARAAIEKLSIEIGADDPEITRALTLLDFMEGDK